MAVKYTYTPIPPGCSDIVYCDVFRMFDGNGITMEFVGRFRGNDATRAKEAVTRRHASLLTNSIDEVHREPEGDAMSNFHIDDDDEDYTPDLFRPLPVDSGAWICWLLIGMLMGLLAGGVLAVWYLK